MYFENLFLLKIIKKLKNNLRLFFYRKTITANSLFHKKKQKIQS